MCENIRTATQLIEQGHVRVGPDVIKDPAFIVTRNMEDFVTWVDTSAIRKRVLEYKEMRDDYDIYCWIHFVKIKCFTNTAFLFSNHTSSLTITWMPST